MRGTRKHRNQSLRQLRIIPAHAGNTDNRLDSLDGRRDHPRACGEHFVLFCFWAWRLGSSPRMRGTPICKASALRNGGIIPAHAGNTPRSTSKHWPPRDHPRACGEHLKKRRLSGKISGSSPRMRGTLRRSRPFASASGIIPAHAGNTVHPRNRQLHAGDHPRACGEHHPCGYCGVDYRGSSPRMRGTHSPYETG